MPGQYMMFTHSIDSNHAMSGQWPSKDKRLMAVWASTRSLESHLQIQVLWHQSSQAWYFNWRLLVTAFTPANHYVLLL